MLCGICATRYYKVYSIRVFMFGRCCCHTPGAAERDWSTYKISERAKPSSRSPNRFVDSANLSRTSLLLEIQAWEVAITMHYLLTNRAPFRYTIRGRTHYKQNVPKWWSPVHRLQFGESVTTCLKWSVNENTQQTVSQLHLVPASIGLVLHLLNLLDLFFGRSDRE